MDPSLPHTIEQLRKLREQVEAVGARFTRPDDDWMPVLQLFSRKKVHVCGLDSSWFASPEMKDQIPGMIARVARQFKAISGGLVISQWTAEFDTSTMGGKAAVALAGELGLQHVPGRKEQVMLEICDGEVTEVWEAPISRFPDRPPALGEWRLREGAYTGRLSNVLQKALSGTRR